MNDFKRTCTLMLCGAMLLFGGIANAAGLDAPASISFDANNVPTIAAETEHDAIFLQGYMHAKDRLFQMDFQRRLFSGTVSELTGPAGLPQDVQLRTLGLRRAAERSLPIQTPETIAWLEAYSAGVNALLADTSIPLPIEYSPLEIDRNGIPPWTPLDSLTMAKGLAFGLSFGLDDIDRTLAVLNFRGVGDVLGFNGLQLFNNDLYRTAPFDPAISIPSGSLAPEGEPQIPEEEEEPGFMSDPNLQANLKNYRDTIAEIPILKRALEADYTEIGSNWWLVSGDHTESGYPMLANDPHLALDQPATFYEIHMVVNGGINLAGVSFPGAPGLVQGCNETICWGSTVNPLDVTDVYQEVLLALDPSQPTTPTHSFYSGAPEPLQFIPQQFLFNIVGDGVPNSTANANLPATQGGVTIVVPRRNNGPIVQVNFDPASPTPLTGFSVAYVGWAGTRELETFRLFARAESMSDFKAALQYFDVGSQNWGYADINGNIAYYTSGELPLRQDLQTLLFPAGLQPPYLIRDGTNTSPHDWLPVTNPQPNQALPYEILPFAEMPQIENPASGVILNANNDPIGTSLDNLSWNQFRPGFNGLLYLSPGYAPGFRMGRIKRKMDEVLAGGGKLSVAESIDIQANNQLLDAEILTPYILDAFANAGEAGVAPELAALGADPGVAEAVGRLAAWDFGTPTGIDEGYDPGDIPTVPGPASAADIEASVAATIYSVWRGQMVQRVIDQTLASLPVPLDGFAPGTNQAMTALRHMLDQSEVTGGVGASLLDFFVVPGVIDQQDSRDVIILQAVRDSLDLLASNEFAPAFGNSTDQSDYRWGKLHRIVFDSFLGGPFSLPPPGSPLNLAPDLPGISRAGGLGAVDASAHSARADGLNEFMFGSGPARRVIATMTPDGPDVLEVIPGGQSGQPGSPFQVDQLFLWLVNAFHALPIPLDEAQAAGVSLLTIACGDGIVGPGEMCDDGNADENDGCNQACMLAPQIACGSPTVDADASTCDASVACEVVATCLDPNGAPVAVGCDSGGPFALGSSSVGVTCSAAGQTTAVSCDVSVADTTPPSFSVAVSPDTLWPPNHRMISVRGIPNASDTCGGTSIVLDSIESSEPDNAPGGGDGNTVNDIQEAAFGTFDLEFLLRAERAGSGDGRTYTVNFTAFDNAGNATSASATVEVDHNRIGIGEPVTLRFQPSPVGTLIKWSDVTNTFAYNMVRGNLEDLQELATHIDMGTVHCVEGGSTDTTNHGYEDMAIPDPGKAFFYVVEFNDGLPSSYGTVTAPKPRLVSAGDCP